MKPDPLRLALPRAGIRSPVLLLFCAGIVFFGMGAFFAWAILAHLFKPDLGKAGVWFIMILPAPAMAAGLGCMLAAAASAIRRTTIVADAAELTVTNSILGIQRRRRFKSSELRGLFLRLGQSLQIQGKSSDALTSATLYVCLTGGGRKAILTRYGGAEMTRVTDALRATLWPDRALDENSMAPGGHLVCISEAPDLAFHMNPQPVGEIAGGSYYVGWIFAAGMPIFSGLIMAIVVLANSDRPTIIIMGLMLALIDPVFIAIGGGICVWASRVAKRQADIGLTDGELRIDVTGPGDLVHHVWARGEVDAVSAGPGSMSVNGQSIQQLNIHSRGGGTVALFGGRDVDDLRYLAKTLHEALGLANPAEVRAAVIQAGAGGAAQTDAELARMDTVLHGSNIVRVAEAGKLALSVRALGIRRASIAAIIFGCIFTLFSLLILAAIFLPQPNGKPTPVWGLVGMSAAFLIPPALIFGHSRRQMRATAHVELTADALYLRWSGTFKNNELRLPCDKIAAVKGGWHSVGDGQSLELQFFMADGALRTAMSGFTESELKTLAAALQSALGLAVG